MNAGRDPAAGWSNPKPSRIPGAARSAANPRGGADFSAWFRRLVGIWPLYDYHFPMKSERPLLLTLICLLGFAACSFGMILVYTPAVLNIGKAYALFRSLSFTSLVVCYGGLWMMRRWGAWALAVCFVLNQLGCLYFGTWDKNTLLPLLFLMVAAAYYRRMR